MKCYKCENLGKKLFEFYICDACKKSLRLHQDETITKNAQNLCKEEPKQAYLLDIKKRILKLDEDYISKKIKLLHIKANLEGFDI
ncbi:MAG: hypothetical protein KC646_07320 [Candidatus Cloacimonetes bacterium]|nr:hypothetical protein [Candidatus Cloacimonadota bacterium]